MQEYNESYGSQTLFGYEPTYFVEVVLPVPINRLFTYRVPRVFNEKIQIGVRVIVPLGPKKLQTGVILSISERNETSFAVKSIEDVLDEAPIFLPSQIDLMHWLASYYMSSPGIVFAAMLPSGFRLSAESKIQINPHADYQQFLPELTASAREIITFLEKENVMSYSQVSNLLMKKTIYPVLKELFIKEVIIFFEEIKDKYTPLVEKRVRLTKPYTKEEQLNELFKKLEKKYKQQQVLLLYLQNCQVIDSPKANKIGMPMGFIKSKGLSEYSLKTLIKNNVFESFDKVIPRIKDFNEKVALPALSEEQERAYEKILSYWDHDKSTVLLRGVTGSGKTMIYAHLIKKCIEQGEQVLLLMPEIALTTQMVERLKHFFGEQMVVYHSKYSDNERVEIWEGVLSGRYQFVLGVRSSVFLPFRNLSIVMMDESHEGSYKQQLKSPRYHTKSIVMMMPLLYHAKVLLGSATPSIETMYLAKTKKIGLVEMKYRFGSGFSPRYDLVDLRISKKLKRMNNAFDKTVLEHLEAVKKEGMQAIVFQNRRGYAPHIECDICGTIPSCSRCDISLTYHLFSDQLVCHYCGYFEPPHKTCVACGGRHIKTVGFGTEKIEEDLKLQLPQSRSIRMDQDTTRSKYGHDRLIKKFSNGEADILVGTQMIAKGLDFGKVRLVVIVDADRMLYAPDFRAVERTYQMLTQVGGRAGRKDNKGYVLMQTHQPEHRVFDWVNNQDYDSLYEEEIIERQTFFYPPFARLIQLTLKSKKEAQAVAAGTYLSDYLRRGLGADRVLGPTKPSVSRIRDFFIQTVLLKLDKKFSNTQLKSVKEKILTSINEMQQDKTFKGVRVTIDVDPN